MVVYRIAVLQTNRNYFNYSYPDASLAIGARVWVPFRQAIKVGIVLGADTSDIPVKNLKEIHAVIDTESLITADILSLCHWVSEYYQSPLALVLALALPKLLRQGKSAEGVLAHYYELTMSVEAAHQSLSSRAVKQHQLLDYMATMQTLSTSQLKQAGFSSQLMASLLQQHMVVQRSLPKQPDVVATTTTKILPLNPEQQQAYDVINLGLSSYQCFLLYGVTGSGKTEVYFYAMEQVLAQGKQVLMLVPEIGLTPQLQQRILARFSLPLVVIHSQMSDGERQQAWLWAKNQQVRLVIGTRSALFTPMPALGLIVIDEEHDSSLKQMEGVRYLARDTALMRAHAANIPIILGSATPSLESLANVAKGKYTVLRLNEKAMNTFPLRYQIVDLRAQKLAHGIASATYTAIKQHLDQGNQVLVFINRRGFSPVLLCHLCGWKADCPACDARLTVHKTANVLICHHCGFTRSGTVVCPSCHGKELIFMGAGTQRIEESLAEAFPETTILRIDRDAVRKKHAFDQHLEQIHAGHAQLIIGTQMLAKGHHFSRLTLVVVLDADYGFYDQDFRALERLGQLMTQVAGRAGRADRPGEVLIQTHVPDHPLLNQLIQHGYEPFAQALLEERRQANMPPYAFLAMLRAQGKYQEKILAFLHAVKIQVSDTALTVMGPAPAPLAKKAGQYRMQLLLKSSSRQQLQQRLTALREWIQSTKLINGVSWTIDVDPMDLS